MIRKHGDMFMHVRDYRTMLATGNATIKTNGALVMGRGAALGMKLRFPGIDLELGKGIQQYNKDNKDYLLYRTRGKRWVGRAFYPGVLQVKHHYKDAAEPELIKKSLDWMVNRCRRARILNSIEENDTEQFLVAINYPGIGNGRLDISEVQDMVEELPDWVHVWTIN